MSQTKERHREYMRVWRRRRKEEERLREWTDRHYPSCMYCGKILNQAEIDFKAKTCMGCFERQANAESNSEFGRYERWAIRYERYDSEREYHETKIGYNQGG